MISGTDNAIRNPEGIWINSNVFREEAIAFKKNGYYCPDMPNSYGWIDYWDEQLRRCKEGYSVGGVRITGHHYFYLNFVEIMLVGENTNSKKATKVSSTPAFWDGDYNYFWALDIAREGATRKFVDGLYLDFRVDDKYLSGGHHMIVGKSRRKGYSYKNAAICANMVNSEPDTLVILGAFDKKYLYPRGTMGMASSYLDHINSHTAWTKAREYVDKQEHRKLSYVRIKNGVKIEEGYKSELMAITFKDNPDAARGKDAKLLLLEESGKFPNLADSFVATKEGLGAGKYITGQMIIFGTGGDMENGTVDFARMFYNPEEFDLMPFVNIWDDNATNSYCGFFHPDYMNLEGFYDEQGNSDKEAAIKYEVDKRNQLRSAASSSASLQQRVQERPHKPSEAFLMVSTNDFPIQELQQQLNLVKRENLNLKKGQSVILTRREDGGIQSNPILDDSVSPVWEYAIKQEDITGCPVIYEYPVNNAPDGLYKIGYDPYRQDQAENSTSLGAAYVYKGFMRGQPTYDCIVASYIGRPNTSDDFHRNLEMLSELYNAEIGFENEVTSVKSYFQRRKKLHLLALQPDRVISTNIKNSKVSRVYGIHMVEKLKDAGEKYIKRWLLTEKNIDENGETILNLQTIYDPGLLEELIQYNRKGNFDRISAFIILQMYLEEEEEDKIYEKNNYDVIKEMEAFTKNLFKK